MLDYIKLGYLIAMIIGLLIGILGLLIGILKKKITALKQTTGSAILAEENASINEAENVFDIVKEVVGNIINNEDLYKSMSSNGVKCGELKSFNVLNAIQKACDKLGVEFDLYDWQSLISKMVELLNYNKVQTSGQVEEKKEVQTSGQTEQKDTISVPKGSKLIFNRCLPNSNTDEYKIINNEVNKL